MGSLTPAPAVGAFREPFFSLLTRPSHVVVSRTRNVEGSRRAGGECTNRDDPRRALLSSIVSTAEGLACTFFFSSSEGDAGNPEGGWLGVMIQCGRRSDVILEACGWRKAGWGSIVADWVCIPREYACDGYRILRPAWQLFQYPRPVLHGGSSETRGYAVLQQKKT